MQNKKLKDLARNPKAMNFFAATGRNITLYKTKNIFQYTER